MLPWYGQAVKEFQHTSHNLSARAADAPSSLNKMSIHDQSTKVNEKASEPNFKHQSQSK
jgi:hypothetical protein